MAIHLARYGWHLAEDSHLAFGHGRGFIFNACARPLLVVTILALVHHEMYQPPSHAKWSSGSKAGSRVPEPLKTSCEIGKPKSVCSKLTRIIILFVPHFCNSICIWTSSFWPCRRIELHKCLDVQRILQHTNLPRLVSHGHSTRTLLES